MRRCCLAGAHPFGKRPLRIPFPAMRERRWSWWTLLPERRRIRPRNPGKNLSRRRPKQLFPKPLSKRKRFLYPLLLPRLTKPLRFRKPRPNPRRKPLLKYRQRRSLPGRPVLLFRKSQGRHPLPRQKLPAQRKPLRPRAGKVHRRVASRAGPNRQSAGIFKKPPSRLSGRGTPGGRGRRRDPACIGRKNRKGDRRKDRVLLRPCFSGPARIGNRQEPLGVSPRAS